MDSGYMVIFHEWDSISHYHSMDWFKGKSTGNPTFHVKKRCVGQRISEKPTLHVAGQILMTYDRSITNSMNNYDLAMGH